MRDESEGFSKGADVGPVVRDDSDRPTNQLGFDFVTRGENFVEPSIVTEATAVDISIYLKQLQRLIVTLKPLQPSGRPLNDGELVKAIGKALHDAQLFDLNGLVEGLKNEEVIVHERLNATVEQRREGLLGAARDSGIPHKRFSEYDRVGPFKVSYKGRKTRLELGSELACELEDAQGAAILEMIQQLLVKLERRPFERDVFFQLVKSALGLACDRGHGRDRWVPVRSLYIHLVLLQNLLSEEFVRNPTAKSFRDYTTAQFVYDLARFGKGGWSCGEESLRAQTPNMVTVSSGKAMTLPNLDAPNSPKDQFALIRIEKA